MIGRSPQAGQEDTMARSASETSLETMDDLLERLGGISPRRVLMCPPPGTATEADLLRVMPKSDRLFELVDGTLVEKVLGYGEGGLAADLIRLLGKFLDQHDLGDLVGADSTMRLLPKLVRVPDVSFICWGKLPGRQRPRRRSPLSAPPAVAEQAQSAQAEEGQDFVSHQQLVPPSLCRYHAAIRRRVKVLGPIEYPEARVYPPLAALCLVGQLLLAQDVLVPFKHVEPVRDADTSGGNLVKLEGLPRRASQGQWR
jgi:hypothetical protein